MTDLEKSRLKMDILKSQAVIAELEFKICESQEQVMRLKDNIKMHEERLVDLNKQLEKQ
jgi:peptidoglycan hydrolase CwlO-like protein